MIESGKPKMLEFGVADETAWQVGLSCGGTHPGLSSRRWTERGMKLDASSRPSERRARGAPRRDRSSPMSASGAQRLVERPTSCRRSARRTCSTSICAPARAAWSETPQGAVFLTVQVPPPRLVVIGAVHISQALAPMARLLGYDVIIVDPRTAFATPERFPGRRR